MKTKTATNKTIKYNAKIICSFRANDRPDPPIETVQLQLQSNLFMVYGLWLSSCIFYRINIFLMSLLYGLERWLKPARYVFSVFFYIIFTKTMMMMWCRGLRHWFTLRTKAHVKIILDSATCWSFNRTVVAPLNFHTPPFLEWVMADRGTVKTALAEEFQSKT